MSEEEKFLREYQKLCQKYKMGLTGCGCCGSPLLEKKEKVITEINYNKKLDKVIINGSGWSIEGNCREKYKTKEKYINEYFMEVNNE